MNRTGYPVVHLKEITEGIQYGYTTSADFTKRGSYKFLRITDIQENNVEWEGVPFAEGLHDENEASKYLLHEGDIVFARTGATTGKSYLISKLPLPTVFASYLIRVRPDQSVVNPEYLAYFFQTPMYWRQVEKNKKGAAQAGVNATVLGELKIPLLPIEDQKKIAGVLSKAQSLIKKRKKIIKKLDELIQVVFLDMFGDPINNKKGFPKGKIKDLVLEAKYGTSKKANENEGEFPYLRMNNLTYDGYMDFSNLKYIDLDEQEKDKYLVKSGDLLFNRTNSKELVGKTAVFEEIESMAIAGYLIRIRTNELGNPYYISSYLNSKHGKMILQNMCKNIVGMANINAKEMQNIDILLPPRSLQDKYEECYKDILKKKCDMSRQLEQLEINFQAILQQAFKGELNVKI